MLPFIYVITLLAVSTPATCTLARSERAASHDHARRAPSTFGRCPSTVTDASFTNVSRTIRKLSHWLPCLTTVMHFQPQFTLSAMAEDNCIYRNAAFELMRTYRYPLRAEQVLHQLLDCVRYHSELIRFCTAPQDKDDDSNVERICQDRQGCVL